MFQRLYKKCLELAAHKSSNFYLGLVSFIESSFFPIPPDAMIIPMVIAKKKEYLKIFLIASIFSVLGGIFGYLIGYLFFDLAIYVIEFYGYQDKVENNKLKRNSPACIIYTSGTGGNPKGVILSHGGILNNLVGACEIMKPLFNSRPVFLTWLPLSHSYEHCVQFAQIAVCLLYTSPSPRDS